jgi:hypothetical protein
MASRESYPRPVMRIKGENRIEIPLIICKEKEFIPLVEQGKLMVINKLFRVFATASQKGCVEGEREGKSSSNAKSQNATNDAPPKTCPQKNRRQQSISQRVRSSPAKNRTIGARFGPLPSFIKREQMMLDFTPLTLEFLLHSKLVDTIVK